LKKFLPVFFFLLFCSAAHANELSVVRDSLTVQLPDDTLQEEQPAPHRIFIPKKENKKLIAAILAFPVPFGFIGLHRIYLGTEPWVPVVYLVTAGGGMLLPFIDFIAIIVADKEQLKKYENNNKLFMWAE
jgi:TM2 domain-containing membrane protein YozV